MNLQPGQYRVRCHGSDGVHTPDGGQEPGSPPILIEPGRTNKEVNFVIPEVKKGVWTKLPYTIETRPVTHYAIYRTPDGMLWVGTEDLPLHRYDGVEYKCFRWRTGPKTRFTEWIARPTARFGSAAPMASAGVVAGQFEPLPIADSLPRNGVREVAVGADGSVWFGTKSGLCKYDGRQFVRFTTQDGLPGNWINSLLRTADGDLLAATGSHLVRFDGKKFSEPEGFIRFGFGKQIGSLHQARDGAIWFSAIGGGGAYRYDGTTLLRLGKEEGLSNDDVRDIAETSDGVIWLATKGGLSGFNGTTVLNYTRTDGVSGNSMAAVYVDSDDVLWCAGDALNRYDPGTFARFTAKDGLGDPVTDASVNSIERDADGHLWFGSGWEGAFRMDGKKLDRRFTGEAS